MHNRVNSVIVKSNDVNSLMLYYNKLVCILVSLVMVRVWCSIIVRCYTLILCYYPILLYYIIL